MGSPDSPSRPHDLCLSFEYHDPDRALTIERSLREEVGEIDDDRSRTVLCREGEVLEVTVEAADLVALRAASNTWLSLVSVAEAAVEIGDGIGRNPSG